MSQEQIAIGVLPYGRTPFLNGSCFCKTVTFALYAPPVLSAFCHCTNCQRLTVLEHYDNPMKRHKRRFRCKTCGVCVASYNMNTFQYSIWGPTLERGTDGKILNWDKIKPTAHQFYGTRVLDVNDELGKWVGYEGKSTKIC
ncbi:hypothetical protein HYDPIDRAFT_183145 [Hydnomerulius pinastri MD-312]|uniref:CENP-V/GFA domain-containing protein n=1 Tax=Hydnomerulius pinastri MD-312 TaxID=994086 RepID=A0A0C9WBU6_9AGAM|nr:hypothetical protein HYDPIDRAFT_183145 [Hydnomerulius pinastri MD-312]